jgi:hypothetical protein
MSIPSGGMPSNVVSHHLKAIKALSSANDAAFLTSIKLIIDGCFAPSMSACIDNVTRKSECCYMLVGHV